MKNLILVFTIFFTFTLYAQKSTCDEVLLTRTNINLSESSAEAVAFYQLIDESNFSEAKRKFGARYKAFSGSYEEFNQHRSRLINQTNYDYSNSDSRDIVSSWLPADARTRWIECQENNSIGLFLWTDESNEDGATVKVKWKTPSGLGSTTIAFTGSNISNVNSLRNTTIGVNGTITIYVSRAEKCKPLRLIVNTTSNGNYSDNILVAGPRCSEELCGTEMDKNGNEYEWVKLRDGNIWMRKDLPGFYTWSEAKSACPSGWRLPSDYEWWRMIEEYGGAYNVEPGRSRNDGQRDGVRAYDNLMERDCPGFYATLNGFQNREGAVNDKGRVGYYWTDTSASQTHGIYYHFNSMPHNLSAIARSTNYKDYSFSCRCVKQ